MKPVEIDLAIMVPRAVENKYRAIFRRALQQQVEPILRILEQQGPASAQQQILLYLSEKPLTAAFQRLISDVGGRYSGMYRDQLVSKTQKTDPRGSGKAWTAYFNEFLAPTILARKADRIKRMTSVTGQMLNDLLTDALQSGESIPKIAAGVNAALDINNLSRARTIARTEVISAANEAAFLGAESTGIKYKKFWSNSGLEQIRDSHLFAQDWSYQQGGIEQHEPFDMGNGNWMMYPGDPEGGAEEVINCRCTLIVLPAE